MEDGLIHLKNYQYHGIDKSVTSKYFMNTFHTKLLFFVPEWMAPNVLTSLGFGCAFMSFLLTLLTDCTLSNQRYRIVFLINGILIFAYQALDAMDGKQARRTGSSSPLGQLFDHGCDLFVLLFVCTSLASALGTGVGYNYIFFFMCFLVVYFVCCVEEYFVGVFYLGYINGPSEGILVACLLHLFAFIFGTSPVKYLLSMKFIEMPLFALVCLLFILSTFIYSTINIMIHRQHSTKRDVFYMITNGYLIFMNTILNTQNKKFRSLTGFYLLLITSIFLMGRLTLDISYSHLRKKKMIDTDFLFKVYAYGSVWLLVVKVPNFFILCIFVGIVGVYLERALFVVNEICEYLGIKCFSLVRRKEGEKEE